MGLALVARDSDDVSLFRFYSDDPSSGLPSKRVRPGDSLFKVAKELALAVGSDGLLGIARFSHVLDTDRNAANIVVTFVATGRVGSSWWSVSQFADTEQPVLDRIASGQVYPLCLLSESEGSDPATAEECATSVSAIRSFFHE